MKKNILANILGKIWGVFSNFLFVPVYIGLLGFESYSIISYTLVLSSVIVILDGGLSATMSREFARQDVNQKDKISTYETLQIIYAGIIIICIVGVFVFSDYLSKGIIVKNYSLAQMSAFFKIVTFDVGFQLLFRFYLGGLLGLNKQILANVVQIFWGIFRNGFVILVIYFYSDLHLFFLWQSAITIVFSIIIKYYLDREIYKRKGFRLALNYSRESFNKIKKFASGILLISVVSVIGSQFDKILISRMISIESLGYYTLAVSIATSLLILVSPITTAILPKFTALFSNKNLVNAKGLFNQFNTYVSVIVFSFLANIVFFSKELLWIWTGDSILVLNSKNYVPIISFAYAFMVLQSISYQVALANGYTKLNNILGIVSIGIILPGYLFFGSQYGGIGIAYCFLFVQFISFIFYIYYINRKFIKQEIFFTVYVKQYLIPLVISLTVALFFEWLNPVDIKNKPLTLFWVGCSTLVTLILVIVFSIPRSQITIQIFQLKRKFNNE